MVHKKNPTPKRLHLLLQPAVRGTDNLRPYSAVSSQRVVTPTVPQIGRNKVQKFYGFRKGNRTNFPPNPPHLTKNSSKTEQKDFPYQPYGLIPLLSCPTRTIRRDINLARRWVRLHVVINWMEHGPRHDPRSLWFTSLCGAQRTGDHRVTSVPSVCKSTD